MTGDEFGDELQEHMSGVGLPNPDMVDVEIVWVRGTPAYGSDHIAAHDVAEAEVEQVLLEIPPAVETKRRRNDSGKCYFWGATRKGRCLFIACEDWTRNGVRYLKPI